MILAIFDLQVTLMLPTKFQVNYSLLVQEKKQKIDFQDGCSGCHLGYLIRTILAVFDLQVTLMLPTKFQLAFHFRKRREKKIFKMVAILDF